MLNHFQSINIIYTKDGGDNYMKETFTYYIDAIVYAVLFTLTIKILEYFKIDFNYIYIIIITLIIFVISKIILKKLINRNKQEIDK